MYLEGATLIVLVCRCIFTDRYIATLIVDAGVCRLNFCIICVDLYMLTDALMSNYQFLKFIYMLLYVYMTYLYIDV